jgi:methyl-accepting chemotaxis protein
MWTTTGSWAILRAKKQAGIQKLLITQIAISAVAILFSLIFGIATISNLRNRLARLGTLSSTSPASWISPRASSSPAMTSWAWWPRHEQTAEPPAGQPQRNQPGALSIASVSEALSQNSSQVASAASQQSSASANVAATVEQMTVSVNHVADRASGQQHDD